MDLSASPVDHSQLLLDPTVNGSDSPRRARDEVEGGLVMIPTDGEVTRGGARGGANGVAAGATGSGSGTSGLDAANVGAPDDANGTGASAAAPSHRNGAGSGLPEATGPDERNPFSWRKLWAFTGPGWLMSLAYIDPGNLESDLQAGAASGYKLLWVLFWSTVLGGMLQIFAAQLGVVTGRHLAEICRDEYARGPRLVLWLMAELAIIGSDIQEVVGSAIAFNLLFGLPLWAGVLITVLDTFTFLFLHKWGIRKLEAFFCTLIFVMAACFVVEFAIGQPDGAGIMEGWIIPTVPSGAVFQAVGMLGAVIMPHNLFLHSALVQSRAVDRTHRPAVRDANFYFALESVGSLAVSFLINLCVLAVFAAGFYDVDNPDNDVGLGNAGDVLQARFGKAARIIWAIGLLAAGQASTMTGTFAGQFVMQGFLDLKVAKWMRTALTRGCAVVPALIVALAFDNELDELSSWLNVLQSIQLPFAVIPLVKFCRIERIVGSAYVHGKKTQAFSFLVVAVCVAVNAYLVVDFVEENLPPTWGTYLVTAVLGVAYVVFLVYIAFVPSAAVSADDQHKRIPMAEAATPSRTAANGTAAADVVYIVSTGAPASNGDL